MSLIVAEVTAESMGLASTSSMLPALMVFVLLLSAATAAIAGATWIVLAIRKRLTQRVRIASAVAMLGFASLLYPVFGIQMAIGSMQPPFIWLIMGPALISIAVGMAGIAWIATRWRADDPNRCADCEHALVDAQKVCPECGAPRTKRRSVLQRRVLATTILALVSGLVGVSAVRVAGTLALPWMARITVAIDDSTGTKIVIGDAEAIVRARTIWWTIEDGYGEGGGLVEVHSATMRELPPTASATTVAGAKPVTNAKPVAVLPTRGTPADDAWFEGVANSFDSWKPECASAARAWARTIARRLDGERAKYGSAAPNVQMSIFLERPLGVALLAVVAAGPLAALLAAPFVLRGLRRAFAS